ncbi:hypothetical protein CEXT_60231, partial [Caerostris extrusa]
DGNASARKGNVEIEVLRLERAGVYECNICFRKWRINRMFCKEKIDVQFSERIVRRELNMTGNDFLKTIRKKPFRKNGKCDLKYLHLVKWK